MNKMRYRTYAAMIEYDDEDRIFIGHLLGIRDIVSFHSRTVEELETACHEAVDPSITGAGRESYCHNLLYRPQRYTCATACCPVISFIRTNTVTANPFPQRLTSHHITGIVNPCLNA